LSQEQQAYCVLIAYFDEIAERNLNPFEAANIFSKIFGESPHIFFRTWLNKKKELIEKVEEFEEPILIKKQGKVTESLISPKVPVQKTIETIISHEIPEQTKARFETKPELSIKPEEIKPSFKDDITTAINWILKKGMERTRQCKNRVTKTWLLNRKDCPKKEVLDKAWKKLIKSETHGKFEKTTFYIDIKVA